jgi:hypothetical protein
MDNSKLNWNNGWECHYGDATVVIDRDYDLKADYDYPRTHKALYRDGRSIRVVIDHDATGTNTSGTGDTVVRSVPRGWTAGDRRYAA